MAAIHQQIAAAERGIADMTRFATRREDFLDGLDWRMMTREQSLMAHCMDEAVNEELAFAHMELEHLHGMEILGFRDRNDQMPFDPDMPGRIGYPIH